MARGFQRQRLTDRSHKTLATAGFLLALLALPMLAGTAMAGGSDEPHNRSKLAPLLNEKVPNRIPDQYIVIFKPGTPRDVFLAAQNKIKGLRGTIRTTYDTSGLIGFSAEMSKSTLQTMRANPSVDYIEVNQTGWFNTVQCKDQSPSCRCGNQPCFPAAEPPTGLDRVSERGILPQNNPDRLDDRYSYSEDGTGVHVYVIDSGIDNTHAEFGLRVAQGIKITSTTIPATLPSPLSETQDCNTHGTHVAGIIGGNTVGIAKGVTLHPVRVNGTGCGDSTLDLVITGVLWVKDNAIRPAVVNLSVSFWIEPEAQRTALKEAVIASINSGITHVIAAGNHNFDACEVPPGTNYWESPALVNKDIRNRAIVVGAVNPSNDTRWAVGSLDGSNFGPCLSLFAPGVHIRSARSNQAQNPPRGGSDLFWTGTSQAAAHVTGVVARILGIPGNNSLTPNEVWGKLHGADNVPTTVVNGVSWQGVTDPGTGSPNEMLHYGSLNNGYNDGDPHITTVNGIHYDFQNGGEFVALRDANGMEIQTRQTPVPGAEHVSINTAIAARVGKHRVTWQPNISGVPDPSGLQLRVDGALTTISENGLNLGDGGRIMKSVDVNGLEIHFPDGSLLIVTSHWWDSQKQWYLNVRVFHTPATEGIMGAIEQDSWLKLEFAETWRVTDKTSLFDYATGQSTQTFTFPSFPTENIRPVTPENETLAKRACDGITDKDMLKDCLFDVAVTGDPIFGKSARIQQQVQRGATSTTVSDDKDPTRIGKQVTFTATVARHERGDVIPTGEVMFLLDGKPVGKPLRLDSSGRARWKTRHIMVGEHRVAAKYIPDKDSVFLSSRSLDEHHTVKGRPRPHGGVGAKKHYGK